MTGFEGSQPPDFPRRLAASIANWKRNLLDLTRRNRALNFKPTKVSTVAIVDELPSEVFRHIYINEAPMRFEASESGKGEERPDDGSPRLDFDDNGDSLEFESESEEALEYVPYDPSSVDERHKDGCLQTRLTPEALDHSLRRIDEQAKSAIEEQGVNTLFLALGMLQYRESRDSDTWFRAPLVLLPVQLTRTSARSGYVVTAGDEDALVNPALVEYLHSSYGISLPELPDSETISDTYNLQTLLKGVADAVAAQSDWSVQTDIYLGLFSFQKLVMFKDLEANAEAIGLHRLIRQLLSRAGSSVHGLPPDIRELPLDSEFTPEATYQVVDADSSQMRAAAAVVKGHDIVIEGPPGTGKSQTITNLVAQALSAGKSVLFVAEKMAALDVVHRRLVAAGLGEFCLELHSSKANKRAVMKELSAALDASLQSVPASTGNSKRLPEVRGVLAEYVKAVHEPFGPLGKSPYDVAGRLESVLQASRIKLTLDIGGTSSEELAAAERALKDLLGHAVSIGIPSAHRWRDTQKTFYTEDELEAVVTFARDVDDSVKVLIVDAERVALLLGISAAADLRSLETLEELADLLGDSPGVPAHILQSESWNSPPPDATSLLDKLRKLRKMRDSLSKKFEADVFDIEHDADIAYIEKKCAGILAFLAMLDGQYRSIKARWLGYRKVGYAPSLLTQAQDLKLVDRTSLLAAELDGVGPAGRDLFGDLWQGSSSDLERLDAYVAYVVRYRGVAITRKLGAEAAKIAENKKPDVSAIRELVGAANRLSETLAKLRSAVAWPDGYFDARPLSDLGKRARDLADNINKAPAWAAFEASRQRAVATIAREAVDAGMAGEVAFEDLVAAFLRSFYMRWMSAVVQARPPLHRFDTVAHEGIVREFRELDEQVLRDNRLGLIGLLRDRVQQKLLQPEVSASLPRLRREMTKQRKLSPLRRTLRDCEAAIRAIKPCFMMSPLTVAQYLDGKQPTFDLVIFDEASQLPTEDAIGAVIRGRQLVVVGDPKQLPPTNFFAVSTGTVSAPIGEDGTPLYDDSESVLEEFMGAAVPMSRLKWHYRSAHESLISFSNVNFYDADLHTFPSVATDTDAVGLQFHFVEGGIYEGKGINLIEARRIADEVVSFAKFQLARKAAGQHSLSLGVGTLNLRQQLAILDELEVRRRDDPSIEPFFERSGHEPFFVKNLENIQGDERDSIFLSVTYGKSVDGRLRYNFGPLNRENGWRRLNVLVTRARRQMKVFSSIRDHDINPTGATSEGPRLLRDFLAYAEHRRLSNSAVSAADDAESPFEREVYQELTRRGVRVQPQVGVCGYRVDLGVIDDTVPGRFVCGIECDGVAYHSMETVRDRDRLRQKVLEDRGWIIHRVWSTDWFKDRQGQIDRLLGLIEESRDLAKNDQVRAKDEQAAKRQGGATADAGEVRPKPEPPHHYVRPVVPAYVMYAENGLQIRGGLLDASLETLADLVARVVDVEGPVHEADVISRMSGLWGTKAGSRIQAFIRDAASLAARKKLVERRGPFYWKPDGACRVRSRADIGIPGDRIAPEEFGEAVKLVLAADCAFPRQALISETRAVLGYSRTGPILEEAIGNVVDALLVQGVLGEGSSGLVLRAKQGFEGMSNGV